MNTLNVSKLITAVTSMLCVTVLMGMGALETVAGIPVITLVIGYMLGNGVAALRGHPVEPIIGRRPNMTPPVTPAAPAPQWTSPDGTTWEKTPEGTWVLSPPADLKR